MSTPAPSAPDDTAAYFATDPAEALHPYVPEFERTRSGFHPAMVRSFISGLLHRIDDLEHQVAGHLPRLAQDAVQLAESPQGQKAIDELMRIALDEITGQKAAAAAEAAKTIADAQAQADRMVAAASEQVTTIVEGARVQAKQLTDNAAARSAAVSEGAGSRLEALTAQHGETRRRLHQIYDVVGGLLAADEGRGSLEAEVERVMPAAAAVAVSARPALTAAPESGS